MPVSSPVLNIDIISIIKRISPLTVFDIGVGAGKYGQMLNEICPSSVVTGCEVDASYLTEFKDKHSFYKNIVTKSIVEIVNTEEIEFDLVIFGDVLEHLKSSEVIDVLDYFQYRTKYILCIYPTGLRQGIWHGHSSERHLCEVRLYDVVSRYNVWEYKKVQDNGFLMNLVLIKGYL
jgi:hypothetical protein